MGVALSFDQTASRQEQLAHEDLRQLVLAHYDRENLALRRYVACLGLDGHSAQDIVHEAFLKLQEHLSAGGEGSNVRAWLYRVVHNLARNRQARFDAGHANLDDIAGFAEPVSDGASPEEKLLREERERRLREAVMRLSEAQRGCLILRAQGLKYREIAEALGLSISTVGEHIQRGLQTLKGHV